MPLTEKSLGARLSRWSSELVESFREWLSGPYYGLKEATDAAFEFLESQHRFEKVTPLSNQRDIFGRWTRGPLTLEVKVDQRDGPQLYFSLEQDWSRGRAYDFRNVVLLLEHGTLSRLDSRRRMDAFRDMEAGSPVEVLQRYAGLLRKYQDRILGDEIGVFSLLESEYRIIEG
ncbi:MAG: hypothetical protein IPG61_05045 [bacterium]|nr:hypothetical protein [bacterium]